MEIKKTKRADVAKERGTSLMIGLVISLSIMFVALEWTQKDDVLAAEPYPIVSFVPEDMIPITLPEKKTVPPPPAAIAKADIIEIVKDDADVDDDIMASIEDNQEWFDPQEYDYVLVEPEPEPEEIFMVVEDQPEFPGGTKALMEYLKKNTERAWLRFSPPLYRVRKGWISAICSPPAVIVGRGAESGIAEEGICRLSVPRRTIKKGSAHGPQYF